MKKNKLKIAIIIAILILVSTIALVLINNKNNTKENFDYRESHYHIEEFDYKKMKDRAYVSQIITTEQEYNDFIKNNIINETEKLKPIDKDFKNENYIVFITSVNSCGESIEYKKYTVNNNKLTLNFDVEYSCGVCTPMYYVYEIAISKKIDVKTEVKHKYKTIKSADCDPNVAYKPILYLYPEEKTNITINFQNEENLTTTYPKFNNEWKVTASPNGDLYDENNNYYYALYWEEKTYKTIDFKEGYYVSKENAIPFLEEKLSLLGLNPKERNEFIMFWLPILEQNEHNLVYFELTAELQSYNKLIIEPTPDTLIRIRMHVKKVDSKKTIKEQELIRQERTGYTAVEWGGTIY